MHFSEKEHNLQMCGKFKLDSNRPGLGWEALFTTAETWKQPRCPSQDEWIKKLRDIHTMEYYSASVLWISKWGGLGQQMGRGRDSDNCLPRSSLPKFNDQEGRVFHRLTRGCACSSIDTEGKGCDQAAWRSLVRGLQESWGKIVFHLPWWWKNLLVTEWEPWDGSSVASTASSFLHYFSFLFLFFSPPPPSSSSLLHNLFLWLLEMGDLKLLMLMSWALKFREDCNFVSLKGISNGCVSQHHGPGPHHVRGDSASQAFIPLKLLASEKGFYYPFFAAC